MDQLYELWDVNASGYLELDEIQVVLNKWRSDGIDNFKEGLCGYFSLVGLCGRASVHQMRRSDV